MGKSILLALLRFYQRCISPFLPRTCRFYPTCSSYAMQAIEKRGMLSGFFLTVKRIFRCHPWHPGGYDPVP